jgi:NADH-quinone oxidoreductase subunit J
VNDRLVPLLITCGVALLSGAGMVMARRLVRCACLLLVHSLAIAATYWCMAAEFLAMAQVVVYTGAIVVLFLFVVLLLPDGGRERRAGPQRFVVALVGGAVTFVAMFAAMYVAIRSGAEPAADDSMFAVAALARTLFGAQLIPFELTGVLLLVAIVGGVSLWHRQGAERKR